MDKACEGNSSPRKPSSLGRALTPRALILGLLAGLFVNLGSPYTESVGFSNFSWSYLPEGGMFPFLALLVVNAGLQRLRPQWALSHAELLVVFVMALCANSTSLFLMYFLLAAIVSPHYFASPENKWDDVLIPYLPRWLIVSDERHAVKWFYHGLPAGARLPWEDWLGPLAVWWPFLAAMLTVSFALAALFRQQWVANEKLSYPLMRLPLELVGRTGTQPTKPFRQRAFCIAVAIPVFFASMDVAHQFWPVVPRVVVDHLGCLQFGGFQVHPLWPHIVVCVNPLALGGAYFVPQDVLLSVWLLYGLAKVEEGVTTVLRLNPGTGGMFVWGNAGLAWQSFGAFLVLVGTVLYNARRTLSATWQQALNRDRHAGPAEPLSPAWQWGLLIAGLTFMVWWLTATGLPTGAAVLFSALVCVIFVGLARIVCQSGIFYVVPPMIAQNPVFHLMGRALGRRGTVALGLTYAWHGDVQTQLAVLAAESMKVAEQAPVPGPQLTAAVASVVALGLLTAPLGVIWLGYRTGAITFHTWLFRSWGPETYRQVLNFYQQPQPFGWMRAGYLAAGCLAMFALTAAHRSLPWWPVHPIGLAAVSSFTMYAVYGAYLLAWMLKGAMMRWGGYKVVQKAAPFFVGLAVGHYLGRVIMLVGYTWLGRPMA
ncbi:MAG: hypothetical protein N2512_01135 [Armatimonadetes bacterium]|nr:hypothetical protein [Armatimonadota bacterium]